MKIDICAGVNDKDQHKEEFSTIAVSALAPSEVWNKFRKNPGSVNQGRNETPMSKLIFSLII